MYRTLKVHQYSSLTCEPGYRVAAASNSRVPVMQKWTLIAVFVTCAAWVPAAWEGKVPQSSLLAWLGSGGESNIRKSSFPVGKIF